MDADTRRCEIHLRRMTPASKGTPAVSYLWALLWKAQITFLWQTFIILTLLKL
jgi:hypothetical protein